MGEGNLLILINILFFFSHMVCRNGFDGLAIMERKMCSII